MKGDIYGRRGLVVRIAYLVTACLYWLVRRISARPAAATVVLCYHGVRSAQRASFAWQMKSLTGRAVSVDELERPAEYSARLPRVCVTFDDAFAGLLDNALPALASATVPATVFVVTGNLGAAPRWSMPTGRPEAVERIMTADELRGLVQHSGLRVGSHTSTHPRLSALSDSQLEAELRDSRAAIEQLLARPVCDLAYPHGAGGEREFEAAARAGYRRVFTLEERCVDPRRDRGCYGRFLMSPDVWRIEFLLTCAGAYEWLYWFRLLLRGGRLARPVAEAGTTA